MDYSFVTVGGWQFIFARYPRWRLVGATNPGGWGQREAALAEALLVLLGHNRG